MWITGKYLMASADSSPFQTDMWTSTFAMWSWRGFPDCFFVFLFLIYNFYNFQFPKQELWNCCFMKKKM